MRKMYSENEIEAMVDSKISGTNDGTNWTKIKINGVEKNIPSGGGGGSLYKYRIFPSSGKIYANGAWQNMTVFYDVSGIILLSKNDTTITINNVSEAINNMVLVRSVISCSDEENYDENINSFVTYDDYDVTYTYVSAFRTAPEESSYDVYETKINFGSTTPEHANTGDIWITAINVSKTSSF